MRVLHVMPGVNGEGGSERSFVDNAPLLMDSGVELHLAVLTTRQRLVPELRASGVVVHDLSGSTSLLGRVDAIRRLIRETSPDLVHATLFYATLPCQLAVIGRRHVPLLVTWANTTYSQQRLEGLEASPWKIGLLRLVEAVAGKLSHSWYHAVTRGVATSNSRALWVHPGRVFVGERGRPQRAPVDTGQFGQESRTALRSELGLDPNQQVVLAVGRQEPQKGQADLIRSFDLVSRQTGAALLIAGREGSASSANEAARAALNNPDAVHLLGHRDDVADLLDLADVFVLSSTHEGAAGAAIEAMAAQTPIVSTRLEGLEGVLEHRRSAILVDRDGFDAALIEVLGDSALRSTLSDNAYNLFLERFTSERSATALRSIYESVIHP